METLLPGYKAKPSLDNSVWYTGHLFSFLADAHTTGGSYSLMEVVIRQGLEPPPHTHSREDEAFFVLEGRIEFLVGDQVLQLGPGETVFMPKNVLHGFRVLTSTAHALIWLTPAGLEKGFRHPAFSVPAPSLTLPPAPDGPPPPEMIGKMIEVFSELGVEFAPPPAQG